MTLRPMSGKEFGYDLNMTTMDRDLGVVFPDRPMQSGSVFVPRELRIADGFLLWRKSSAVYKDPKSGMLAGFIRLWDLPDSDVLSYACKWGVLGLCEHELPCSHNQYPLGLMEGVRPCLPMLQLPWEGSDNWFKEPLDLWRLWSRKSSSLMDIGARLNQGKAARLADWQVIQGVAPTGLETESPHARLTEEVSKGRADLSWELDRWLAIGQVRPLIRWKKETQKWQFCLDSVTSGPNLFGLLALSLALSIAGTELAVCCSCGQSYLPDRRPDPDRRNYCSACGKTAAQRDASRAYRQRTKVASVREPGV
jgi:hypothetical protein